MVTSSLFLQAVYNKFPALQYIEPIYKPQQQMNLD